MATASHCRAAVVLSVLFSIASAAGCSDPAASVRARLSPPERAIFERGERIATPCYSCHAFMQPLHKTGPSLRGVYGRKVGSVAGFSFSEGFRASEQVWNDATLTRFLRNVSGFVPGTTMISPGVQDPAQLRDLLFYMRLVTEIEE